MVGTNDLREDGAEPLESYKLYKGKIEQIRNHNPKANIFVCPVLPSRNRALNGKINEFNSYLFEDLLQTNLKINIVHGFKEFAGRDGLLRQGLHDSRTASDTLHINDRGYCVLVRLIKHALFSIKRNGGKHTTGRLYSKVADPKS